MIRRVVFYAGRVQGVGFRHTTAVTARRFAVAGYVQNLPDGTVCVEVQGEKGEVDAFLAAVDYVMARNIRSKDVTEHPPSDGLGAPGGIDAFDVRY